MEKLSAFVTTFNNDKTLATCLESVKWADEIVVLDSFSTDRSLDIARDYGCKILQHEFMGYGKQKQLALDNTSHNWAVLLDADEALSPELQAQIKQVLAAGPDCDGYTLPRQEQLFWRMCSPRVRMNYYLRMFDKRKAALTDMPIHAAPETTGSIKQLHAPFYHFGEPDIHTKVEKINSYSTGLVDDKVAKGKRPGPWIMLLYPPLAFIKLYFFKRNFVNGWGGFITSVTGAFYAFLKYAKLYEYYQYKEHGTRLLPPGAPLLYPRLKSGD